jgi:UDP-N-acetylglucosamine 2-epimerase (non-hydrolysing)
MANEISANNDVLRNAVIWANDKKRPLFVIILATKPCYIKLAPLIYAFREQDVPFLLVESGQHYEDGLTAAKFEFGYEKFIGANLNSNGNLSELGCKIFKNSEYLSLLLKEQKPNVPLIPIVSGDTATAGLLPQAWYMRNGVRSVHVEAGLRCYGPKYFRSVKDASELPEQFSREWILMRDDPFPEGICSRLASQASQILIAPVCRNRLELIREGYSSEDIYMTGSLISDVISNRFSDCAMDLPEECKAGRWIRVDIHRRENMTESRLLAILGGLRQLNMEGLKTILILTNALKGALDRFRLWSAIDAHTDTGGLVQTPWKFHSSVVHFMKSSNCVAIYTDSGGLQEEAAILNVPCFTCRFGTDRPETVLDFNRNYLVPPISKEVVAQGIIFGLSFYDKKISTKITAPYGLNVAKSIVSILKGATFSDALPGASATYR